MRRALSKKSDISMNSNGKVIPNEMDVTIAPSGGASASLFLIPLERGSQSKIAHNPESHGRNPGREMVRC